MLNGLGLATVKIGAKPANQHNCYTLHYKCKKKPPPNGPFNLALDLRIGLVSAVSV